MHEALPLDVRPISRDDLAFVRAELTRNWFSPVIWSRGVRFQADQLPGFVAWHHDRPVGLLTLAAFDPRQYEVVTLSALLENSGVGTALLDAAVQFARQRGARRLLLTTSNDNLRALGFYQRRGWRLVRVYPGEIDRCRNDNKEIPLLGMNRISLRDELELEFPLDAAPASTTPG